MDKSITEKLSRKLKEFKPFRDLLLSLDDIVKLNYELPDQLQAQDWARVEIDTSGYDAVRSATNVFSAYLPKWDVQPRGPANSDNAETLEAWLKWQYGLIDRRNGSAVWNMMKQAVTYDVFCARLDYLPHLFGSKPTKRQKMQLRDGSYALVEHHPSNLLWEKTPMGLDWVSVAENTLASDILGYWKDVKGANVKALKKMIDDDPEGKINYFDYEDYDKRVVAFYASNGLDSEVIDSSKWEIIYEEKNDKQFISWVISVGGTGYERSPEHMVEPLIAPLHRSGSWANQCLHESLQTSKTLRRWGLPDMITVTNDGEGVEVEYDASVDQITLSPGEEAKPYPAPPIDPGMTELVGRGRAKMQGNMGVSTLQNPEVTGNTPFSTLNAQIQLALTALEKPKRVAEQALVQIGVLMFSWIDFKGDTVSAFRSTADGTDILQNRGAQIDISKDDFSLEMLYLNAKMIPNNPTDKLQRMNFAIQANKELQIPISELIESLELGNFDVLNAKWTEEQIQLNALMTFFEGKKLEQQMQMQMAMQQATQAPQAQGLANPPGQGPQPQSIPSQETANGPGFNANGGSPNQMVSPADTREQLNGRTFTGEDIG